MLDISHILSATSLALLTLISGGALVKRQLLVVGNHTTIILNIIEQYLCNILNTHYALTSHSSEFV